MLQQEPLDATDRDAASVELDLALIEVDEGVAHLAPAAEHPPAPAQHGPNACGKLARVEGLGDEVVGALVKSGRYGRCRRLLVDEDHGQWMTFPQLLEQLEARWIGQVNAEQQQVRVELAYLVQRTQPVMGGFDTESFFAQRKGNESGELGLPIGDQHERPVVHDNPREEQQAYGGNRSRRALPPPRCACGWLTGDQLTAATPGAPGSTTSAGRISSSGS